MFKKFIRKIRKNPLEVIIKKAKRKNKKRFLLCWNRGLGDIPLGLYAICKKIKENIANAKITFLIREDLKEGFYLFKEADFIIAKGWERGIFYKLPNLNGFDIIIKNPDPNYWVKWQIGKITPKLNWKNSLDNLYEKFNLTEKDYIGVQVISDTTHSPWRDWPQYKWESFFKKIKNKKIIIFGKKIDKKFDFSNILDLRGKTSFLDVLSIIKNRCSKVVLPDGGILSILYYLDIDFPIKIISLWCDIQGILKQNVSSPNKKLIHIPIYKKTMDDIKVEEVLKYL
ncbi:MAG: hypothetical protein AMS24_03700 [Chlamydiae bacterium SM23_39]|nr:MAG: hypothetical protein AMS24_03700 [Chlamydiae bacterium SM23_39]